MPRDGGSRNWYLATFSDSSAFCVDIRKSGVLS
jgi:hypothetical protein